MLNNQSAFSTLIKRYKLKTKDMIYNVETSQLITNIKNSKIGILKVIMIVLGILAVFYGFVNSIGSLLNYYDPFGQHDPNAGFSFKLIYIVVFIIVSLLYLVMYSIQLIYISYKYDQLLVKYEHFDGLRLNGNKIPIEVAKIRNGKTKLVIYVINLLLCMFVSYYLMSIRLWHIPLALFCMFGCFLIYTLIIASYYVFRAIVNKLTQKDTLLPL